MMVVSGDSALRVRFPALRLGLFVLGVPGLLGQSKTATARKVGAAAASPVLGTQLPVTRVVLYKNGVGLFEHSGRVTGDQAVTIDLTTAALNDVLQTLTAIDLGGGRVTGAGYNSTTPVEQQLRGMPLGLAADATAVDFYNAIRGARVEVRAAGVATVGRLLSVELRMTEATEKEPATERRYLTVVGDGGEVRTVELTGGTQVRLLEASLHGDVTRYLELLASTRNAGLRHLTLQDNGTGARELRVSYLSEVPVWKSTYRILFTDAKTAGAGTSQTATLQGWSVVDNTTGADWNRVQLSLIAGAPQSFIQPISTPYYTRRPEIPLPAEAQLTPQTHESGEEEGMASPTKIPKKVEMVKEDGPPPPANFFGVTAGGTVAMAQNSAQQKAMRGQLHGSYSGSAGGSANGALAGVGSGLGGGYAAAAPPASIDYAEAAEQSITPQTTANAFDDYFEYKLTEPVTIRKNESALVPILQTPVAVERVTLWSPRQPQTALRALWITNTSDLTLDRGSFSITENGNFDGEGLLDPIHPKERRLLSYAADQAVRVTTDYQHNTRRVERLVIKKGVLTQTSTDIQEEEYLVRNAAPDGRTVIVEHAVRPGWTLDSDPKPSETTPTTYRFRVVTQPRETVRLHIGERHTNREYIRLVDRTEEQLTLLLRNAKASAAAMAALQPVFNAHHAVVATDEQIRAKEAEVTSITADQERVRENMKALKGSRQERALLARYTGELNGQEDRLGVLRGELDRLRAERVAADGRFQAALDAVDLDESL